MHCMTNCLDETVCGSNSSDVPLINNGRQPSLHAKDHVTLIIALQYLLLRTGAQIDQTQLETIQCSNGGMINHHHRHRKCYS